MMDWADEQAGQIIDDDPFKLRENMAQRLRDAYERGQIDLIDHEDAKAFARGYAFGWTDAKTAVVSALDKSPHDLR